MSAEGAHFRVNREDPEKTTEPAIWLQVTNQDMTEHSRYLLVHGQEANTPSTSTLCLQD